MRSRVIASDCKERSNLNILDCFVATLLAMTLLSCQTTRPMQTSNETPEDVKQAIGSVAGAMSGKKMSEAEVDKLVNDISKDEKAQSAINSIANSMDPKQDKRIKYSPATGKRYAPNVEYDPETGVKLEYVQ